MNIIKIVLKDNGLNEDDHYEFEDYQEMKEKLSLNPDMISVGTEIKVETGPKIIIDTNIFYNSSRVLGLWGEEQSNYLAEIQNSLNNAITKISVNKEDQRKRIIDYTFLEYPDYYDIWSQRNKPQEISNQHIQKALTMYYATPIFLSIGFLFNWILMAYRLVSEKNDSTRFLMNLMGMKSSAYWISTFFSNFIINLFSFFIAYLIGYLTGIEFFTHTNPFIIFLIFGTYIIYLILLGMLLTSFFSNLIIISKFISTHFSDNCFYF